MIFFVLLDILTGDTRQQLNITYFSFTATPTVEALQMFGVNRNDILEPFHTYSISEAIRDGHICNPLGNYITVSTKAIITPTSSDDTSHRANLTRVLQHVTRAATENPTLLRSRAQFIIDHYVNEIRKQKTTQNFNPKAIVVANSRICILRYKQILEELVSKLPKKDQFEIVAAFTPFSHKGVCYYEEDVNSQYGVNFLREFQSIDSNVQMIIVHSKLLIGFDEPALHTMFVSFFFFVFFSPEFLKMEIQKIIQEHSFVSLFSIEFDILIFSKTNSNLKQMIHKKNLIYSLVGHWSSNA